MTEFLFDDPTTTYQKVAIRTKDYEESFIGTPFYWENVDNFLVSRQPGPGMLVAGYKVELPDFLKSQEETGPEMSWRFIMTKGVIRV